MHEHEHEIESNNKLKIIVAAVLLVAMAFVEQKFNLSNMLKIIFYLVIYLLVGFEVLKKAFKRILKGDAFDECFLMSIATIAAFVIGEYREAVAVMLFYQIGDLFEDYAKDKSEENIVELMNIRPDKAYISKDGKVEEVNPADIEVGSILVIKNGDKVPIDGVVVEGSTELNTVALTGESIPRSVKLCDMVLSGSINMSSTIKIKTVKRFEDSTASKIIDLVKNASEKKSKSEKFITGFAKVYTPIVCLIALLIFVLPQVYSFIMYGKSDIVAWAYRAVTILVISCPCSLVVSIPLAFFASVGKASKKGILIKGTNNIETLSKLNTMIVDKTGTMTKGVFEIVAVHNEENIDEKDVLKYAAYVENYSNHPIAHCIKKEYNQSIDELKIKDCKEIGGYGLSAYVDGKYVLVGSKRLMKDNNILVKDCELSGTEVHVAVDNVYYGHIIISDVIRDEAKDTISLLKQKYVDDVIMLTGDDEKVAKAVANKIGITEYHAKLLPDDKLRYVESMYIENNKQKIAFVGDGINDAPVLVRSDIGISMGGIGSDASVEASDVVIMDDNLTKIITTLDISKRTMRVVYEIIVLSLAVKIIVLICSIFGITSMWLAVFADVGMLIICILNALRLLF